MSKIYVDEIAGIASPSTVAIPGHVIQVVTDVRTSNTTTSSTSFVTANHSATITPTSASSKILILNSGAVYNTLSNAGVDTTIYRGATNLATNGFGYLYNGTGGDGGGTASIMYVDSPSTTDATTYTVYFRVRSRGVGYYPAGNPLHATITLMEIAG